MKLKRKLKRLYATPPAPRLITQLEASNHGAMQRYYIRERMAEINARAKHEQAIGEIEKAQALSSPD